MLRWPHQTQGHLLPHHGHLRQSDAPIQRHRATGHQPAIITNQDRASSRNQRLVPPSQTTSPPTRRGPLQEDHHPEQGPPLSDPDPNTTSSTVYVYNTNTPPRGQSWKPAFKRAFDRISSGHPVQRLRVTLKTATYAPHYPNMICLRISHAAGLSNTDLLQALQKLGEGQAFGPNKNRFCVGRTFTDIVITFEEGTNLPAQATTAASQIARFLGLERANHPPKWIEDYRSEGPALRIPILTSSLKSRYSSFPFNKGGLNVQLYQREGDTVKYTDYKGNTPLRD